MRSQLCTIHSIVMKSGKNQCRKESSCRLFCRLCSPHFSSGIVEQAKRERAWKSPHARKARRPFLSHRRVSPFSRGMIFTRARVSLALLSLRKNGDYSLSIYFESSLTLHILLFNGYEDTKLLYVLLLSFLPRYVVNNTFDLVPPRFFCLFEGYDSTVFLLNVSSNQFCSASTPKRFKIKH